VVLTDQPTMAAGGSVPRTLPDLLRRRATQLADRPWLICDEDILTFREADERSGRLAAQLLELGAGKGTRVGLLHPNGSDFVVCWLAAARIGAISVPLSTFSTAVELGQMMTGADVEILLVTTTFRNRDYSETLAELLPGTDLSERILDARLPSLRFVRLSDAQGRADPAPAAPDATAQRLAAVEDAVTAADRLVMVHTSGSTSAPKAVVHLHGPLLQHIDNLNQLRGFTEADVLFSNSPFFWIGGFAYSLLGSLLAGGTLLCSNATDPAAALDLLERTRPTMVNGFAATVAQLAKDPTFAGRDLTSIRRGNLYPIMPPDLQPKDPELRHNMLGMTEAGSVCLLSEDESDQPEERRGSFGRPAPGLEAAIHDPESGEPCEVGQIGELRLRGPYLMDGYYGRERYETFTADQWYRTGDLFRVDGDGYYYFAGRHGDMIKTAGANVSPREVEAAILDVTGLVAHVVGIDDPARGQLVAAAVRVPAGDKGPDTSELTAALRARLSAYKVPKSYLMLADADVPMLSSGKLDATRLKELFCAE
jgi:acyl-CoA synthetase (AMP-forming)/AMP-acid ligase II